MAALVSMAEGLTPRTRVKKIKDWEWMERGHDIRVQQLEEKRYRRQQLQAIAKVIACIRSVLLRP